MNGPLSPAIASSRNPTQYPTIGCLPKFFRFSPQSSYSQATPFSYVESSHLPGKNYESLLSRARLLVCFQSPLWQSTCLYPPRKMNRIHSNGENNFAATRIKTKIRSGFVSKWRNGPCFRYMAARPHTLSQLWRSLAAQTNVLSAVSRLQFLSGLRTDRGGPAHL